MEGIIWEADEDCDHALTWAEFQSMYHRCRNDQTGMLHQSPFIMLAVSRLLFMWCMLSRHSELASRV